MQKIVFPYQFHSGPLGVQLLPMCTVVLLGSRRCPVSAVIDSGATDPIFPLASAIDAGIDLTTARPYRVIFGGSIHVGSRVQLNMLIGQERLRSDVVFVEDIKLGYALLGRATVFNRFNEVAFLERTNVQRVEFRW